MERMVMKRPERNEGERNCTKASGKKILWQMNWQEQSPNCGFRSGMTEDWQHI